MLIAKIFNSGKSSLYESHHLVGTFMKYNVLVLRLQFTTFKDKLKKKKKRFLCFIRIDNIPYDPTRFYIWSYNFYDSCAILNVLVRCDHKIMQSYNLDRNFDYHDWNYKLCKIMIKNFVL